MVFAPAYVNEEEVLALKTQGYTLVSSEKLEIETTIVSPIDGLKNATIALSKKGAFGALDALYIRKSSAEINAEANK